MDPSSARILSFVKSSINKSSFKVLSDITISCGHFNNMARLTKFNYFRAITFIFLECGNYLELCQKSHILQLILLMAQWVDMEALANKNHASLS